jgi:hypothetical protein
MVAGIGGAAPGMDLVRAFDDLGRLLQRSQAEVMQMAEKLLKVSVQQTISDTSAGNRVDLTA